jgi:hypothetical protein
MDKQATEKEQCNRGMRHSPKPSNEMANRESQESRVPLVWNEILVVKNDVEK